MGGAGAIERRGWVSGKKVMKVERVLGVRVFGAVMGLGTGVRAGGDRAWLGCGRDAEWGRGVELGRRGRGQRAIDQDASSSCKEDASSNAPTIIKFGCRPTSAMQRD